MATFTDASALSLIALLSAIVALVVAALLLKKNYHKALARPLRDLAAANGWRYDEAGPERLLPRFRRFGPLRRAWPGERAFVAEEAAEGHDIRHVISGQVKGHHFHLFEYDRDPEPGKAGRRREQYAMAAVRTGAFCPGLVVRRRKSLPQEVAARPNDLDIPDAAFHARFRATAADAGFAARALNQANRAWMHRTAVDWEWQGHWLVIWWPGRLKAPDCIRALKKLTGFTDRLPADMRPRPEAPEETWQDEGWPEARA